MTPVRAPQPSAGRRYTVALVFAGCVTFINSDAAAAARAGANLPVRISFVLAQGQLCFAGVAQRKTAI